MHKCPRGQSVSVLSSIPAQTCIGYCATPPVAVSSAVLVSTATVTGISLEPVLATLISTNESSSFTV